MPHWFSCSLPLRYTFLYHTTITRLDGVGTGQKRIDQISKGAALLIYGSVSSFPLS